MIHGPPLPSFAPAKQTKSTSNDTHTLTTKSSISDVSGLLDRIRKPWKSNNLGSKLSSSVSNHNDDSSEITSTRRSGDDASTSSISQSRPVGSRESELVIVSNPCFHPLLQKLTPRIEPVMKRQPTKRSVSPGSTSSVKPPFNRTYTGSSLSGSTYGTTRDSANSAPARSARASNIMNGAVEGSREEMSLRELLAQEEHESRDMPKHQLGKKIVDRPTSQRYHRRSKSATNATSRLQPKLTSAQGKRQPLEPNAVALTLSQGDRTRKFVWDKYLDQYSKAAYNMCNPPSPEVVDLDFTYLPAVYPHDEANRLSVATRFESLWPQYGAEDGAQLVKQAALFFDVEFAAISFFDKTREIFKAQHGMDSDGVFARPYSIAAHALYNMDVFVVTDTKQDWRFRKNPWVEQWPGVRFVAIAPMMADNQVVGTFTILDKHPRPMFSYENRRDLVDFADGAMENMKQFESNQRLDVYRQTPILERDSVVFGSQRGFASSSTISAPLTISKTMTIQQTVIDLPVGGDELTPPSSADESRPFNEPPARSPHIATQYIFPRPPRTTSGSLMNSSRPYSVSDLSSVQDNPAPTPQLQEKLPTNRSVGELTSEHFFGLSDRDLYEPSIMEAPENRVATEKSIYGGKLSKHTSSKDVRYEDWKGFGRERSTRDNMSQAENSDDEGEEFTGPLNLDLSREYNQFLKSDPSPERKYKLLTIDTMADERRGVHPGPPPSVAPPPIPRALRSPISNFSTPNRSPLLPQSANSQKHPQRSSSMVSLVSSPKGSPRAICAQNGVRYSATDHHANLTSVCANIASTLNFDLVYLVEVNTLPPSPNTDKRASLSNQISTKILSHYPLINPDTIVVGAAQHVETLHKTLSIFTGDVNHVARKNVQPALKGYQFGILLSLGVGAPQSTPTNGVILGAFKSDQSHLLLKTAPNTPNQTNAEVAEVEKLKDMVKILALEELLEQEEARKHGFLVDERTPMLHSTLENLNEEEPENDGFGLGLDFQIETTNENAAPLSPNPEIRVQHVVVPESSGGKNADKEKSYSDDDEIF